MPILRKLCAREPARRKFFPAISHILSSEHAKLEHLFWCQLRCESAAECASHRFGAEINVALLHLVVHLHSYRIHFQCSEGKQELRNKIPTINSCLS